MSAAPIDELEMASRRTDNAQLLAALPYAGVDMPTVLRQIEERREET